MALLPPAYYKIWPAFISGKFAAGLQKYDVEELT